MSNIDKETVKHNFLDEIRGVINDAGSRDEILKKTLQLLAARHSAILAVIWTWDGIEYQPFIQVQAKNLEVPQLSLSEIEHQQLLLESVAEPKLHSKVSVDSTCTLVTTKLDGGSNEVLELMLNSPREMDSDDILELATTCRILQRSTTPQKVATSQPQENHSENRIDEFAQLIHESIDFRDTCDNVANEMRRSLKVDRVSVVCRHGSRWTIKSISGQVKVNWRSSTIRRLQKVANRVLKTGRSFWHPSNQSMLPQIEAPLDDYLDHSETRSLVIIPILLRKPDEENDDQPNKARHNPVIAGIIVESCSRLLNDEEFRPRMDSFMSHVSIAIRNANLHRELFLYPVWRFLGRSKVVMAARHLPKTLAVFASILSIGLLLTFLPANFNVVGDGVLVPRERQNIFAELEGIISKVHVRHGDKVVEGQPVIQLTNEDLEFQIEQVSGEIEGLSQRLDATQASRITARASQENNDDSNVRGIVTQLEGLQRQLETLLQKSGRLDVFCPIDGQIITWDVKDRLLNRPVQPGELLVEVAAIDGDRELLVKIPAQNVGHVLQAKQDLGELKVTYAVASDPGVWLHGEVQDIEGSTRLQADQSQTVTLRVKISQNDQMLPANTGVVAKVFCGKRSLGYVWARGAIEFVYEKIVFPIW